MYLIFANPLGSKLPPCWRSTFDRQVSCVNTEITLCECLCFISSQNFYKSEINKEEMYIRYIHKLCDMHLQAENYTGTAQTNRHVSTCTHTYTQCGRCVTVVLLYLCVHRGCVHSAVILGAAALGRAASERVPALSCSDRVAPQGGALPQSHPLLQQGKGKKMMPTELHTESNITDAQ